mmetsp:Transcript_21075/g.27348  ORF Transcript_21075/g.27348 Transcript_21075/m.27348 type:complete len:107 (-) Transcript_21075:10-330(-)
MLAEFWCGNSKLRVHTGRTQGEGYEERLCRFCMEEDKLEDEIHVSLECECFQSQRDRLCSYMLQRSPFFDRMEPLQKLRVIMSDYKAQRLLILTPIHSMPVVLIDW